MKSVWEYGAEENMEAYERKSKNEMIMGRDNLGHGRIH